jgi:hypothetical protein
MIIRRTIGLLSNLITMRRTFGLLRSFSMVFAFSGRLPFFRAAFSSRA